MTGRLARRYTGHVIRKQRVTRVVYGVFVVLVAAFVVSSITQVARIVFGEPKSAAAADARATKVGPECALKVEGQLAAIEQARLAAGTESSGEAATARYARERSASKAAGEDLERVCARDPHGTEALAALARLDRAAETHAIRDAAELSPVRLAAQSFISGHPR